VDDEQTARTRAGAISGWAIVTSLMTAVALIVYTLTAEGSWITWTLWVTWAILAAGTVWAASVVRRADRAE